MYIPNALTTKPLRPDILTDIHTPLNLAGNKMKTNVSNFRPSGKICEFQVCQFVKSMPNLLPNACLQGI